MTKTFEFYWQDLTEECQKRMVKGFGYHFVKILFA